jgi:hypothetical protein
MAVKSKHLITHTKNDKEVYACLTQGSLSTQIGRNPHLLQLVSEVLSKRQLTAQEVTVAYDLGREIGYSQILETADKDAVFYAKLARNPYVTRFVKYRKNDQTSLLSLQLQADEDGNYELLGVWMGPTYPPTPDEPGATPESVAYWQTHAFVFNGQPVLSSTITKDWPY